LGRPVIPVYFRNAFCAARDTHLSGDRSYGAASKTVQVTANAELFRQTLFDYRGQGRFLLHAYVIMPDHFHALITPAAEVSLEKAMQFIKGGFSFCLKSKMDVWMPSYNKSQISTATKFVECVRYIEENPVRARLVSSADAYAFSSTGEDGMDPMPARFRG
jgi:putative transposase